MRKSYDQLTIAQAQQVPEVLHLDGPNAADPYRFEYELSDGGTVLYADLPESKYPPAGGGVFTLRTAPHYRAPARGYPSQEG